MNANVIEFYKKVRTDQGLIEALSEGKTAEQVSEIAVKKAAEMGITLETADVIAALGQFQELAAGAANDDELTEFELELVAAGNAVWCDSDDA
ncbi:MAG TPA: hypothetical protein DIW51_08550 [Rhodospirillaceae bacterium]|nr:hypothetical protein [Magnetovibrio sp.]HBT41522.1 hypothetical protein [Rhodospirillaceae bacterium]HCS70005.1 hypothetical protein [Rhodospirillaceae bacterium]|tara:strand:- start:2611 stop:2889 length:279 start_codon:yes stop_codon:yes gene_type:complete